MTNPPDAVEPGARAAALYRIMGGVVHDISNPLQALVMNAELAADEEPAPGAPDADSRQAELQATRLMQTIVRALTTLAAAGVHDRPFGDVAQRFDALLSRRWTRLGLQFDARVHDKRNIPVPATVEEILLLVGIELSAWLRTRPARGATMYLAADSTTTGLTIRLGCDDTDVAAAMCEAMSERIPGFRGVALEVDVHLERDAIVIGYDGGRR